MDKFNVDLSDDQPTSYSQTCLIWPQFVQNWVMVMVGYGYLHGTNSRLQLLKGAVHKSVDSQSYHLGKSKVLGGLIKQVLLYLK